MILYTLHALKSRPTRSGGLALLRARCRLTVREMTVRLPSPQSRKKEISKENGEGFFQRVQGWHLRDLVYLAKGNELTVVANLFTYIRSKERIV
jgi:hypothetical protein